MKIQNIIKVLWKIKFGSKNLKLREAPTATSPREPLEAIGQRGQQQVHLWCGRTRGLATPSPALLALLLLQRQGAVALCLL